MRFICLFLLALAFTGCNTSDKKHRKVYILKNKGKYTLYRNGKPYTIKGAAGYENMKKVREYGGNSIRTWSCQNADSILNEAHRHGLSVVLGLDILSERHGFDYNDKVAVQKQLDSVKKVVVKYKDHPALLMWGIGNELDVYSAYSRSKNLKVWNAVNDIAKMIHEIDPDHPTTTMIVPFRKTIWYVKKRCPHIDILSINSFGELADISGKLREPIWGWNKPYIISEWGTLGWWEVERTLWNAPIEATSTKKSEFYKERYSAVSNDSSKCLGSYVFYWGQKQERTPTWFSMYTPYGEETEAVSTMQFLWTGNHCPNRAPQLNYVLLNKKGARENIFLNSRELCHAFLDYSEPDKDSVKILWELRPDLLEEKGGGDKEKVPTKLMEATTSGEKQFSFTAPEKEGPYRLYVYVSDGKGKSATANIPFFVVE